MSTQYFIHQGEQDASGPYDVLAMMKKIRGGVVTPDSLVLVGKYAEPQPASTVEELQAFFEPDAEDESGSQPVQSLGSTGERTLSQSLRFGFSFLQNNIMSLVYAGMIMLAIVMLMLPVFTWIPSAGRVPFFLISYTISIFLFFVYMCVVLRMVRGQSADWQEVVEFTLDNRMALLIMSVIVAILSIIGIVLLVVPGLFAFALFVYAPLFLSDRRENVWSAMDSSRRFVMAHGTDHLGVIFALVVINLIAGLLVAPLVFTLPVTLSALVDIYEDSDYK